MEETGVKAVRPKNKETVDNEHFCELATTVQKNKNLT